MQRRTIILHGPAAEALDRLHEQTGKSRARLVRELVLDAVGGKDHHPTRLSVEEVLEIRTRYAQGEPQTSLARSFRVSQPTISGIVRGHTWSTVGGPIAETRHRGVRLTEAEVKEIREELATPGRSVQRIADYFGVSKGTIYDIAKGRTHRGRS